MQKSHCTSELHILYNPLDTCAVLTLCKCMFAKLEYLCKFNQYCENGECIFAHTSNLYHYSNFLSYLFVNLYWLVFDIYDIFINNIAHASQSEMPNIS